MKTREDFENRPRYYALELVDNCDVTAEAMLHQALTYLSPDELKDMLDRNEWSPRHLSDDDDESNTDEIGYRDCGLW